MVLGKYRNIFEDDEPIPANANSWDFLPVPANGRPSFDVMPVLTWKNFTALEQTPTKAISSRKISNCIGAPRLGLAANLVFFCAIFHHSSSRTKLFHSSSSTKHLTTPTELFITLHVRRRQYEE